MVRARMRLFEQALRERGLKSTAQRDDIARAFFGAGEHLSVEDLHTAVKKVNPRVGYATVYRTLKLLKDGGLVDELDLAHFQGDQHYYETRMKQEHAHIICLRCGRVEEFFGEELQHLRSQVHSQFGFEIVFARTEVGGYCSHCQALRAQEEAVPQEPLVLQKTAEQE